MLKLTELGINRHGKLTTRCLHEDKQELLAQAQEILDKVDQAKRSITVEEKKQFDEIHALIAAMDPLFDRARAAEDANRRAADRFDSGSSGAERWIDNDGREIRTLTKDESIACVFPQRAAHEMQPLRMGSYIRGLVLGNWRGAEAEHRAMSEGVLAAGGYTVPSPLAADVIDKARNAAVCFQAGAITVPMTSQTLAIARLTQDPTPGWHSEAGTIAATDLAFDRVTFTAQTLVAICQLSVELIEDAPNLDALVSSTLGKALALELDRACLLGSGTPPEPKGIRNQTGVAIDSVTTFGANGSFITNAAPVGAVGFAWLAKAAAAVLTLNERPNAAIYAPRTAGELDQLVDTLGQPMRPPESVAALQRLATAALPINQTQGTSSDATPAFVGDFTKLMVGMRTELVLEISRVANVGATSMFSTMQVAIRAYLRADVQLARPAAFRVILGIR